jgi:hypothetical protein
MRDAVIRDHNTIAAGVTPAQILPACKRAADFKLTAPQGR